MASPLSILKNFTGGFFGAARPTPYETAAKSLLDADTTPAVKSAPYVWATGSTIGGYGVEYGYGTAGANQDIRWDKWGAAFATVVSEPLFRCVEKRSTTVGATPWHIIDNRTEDMVITSKDIDSDNPLARALFRFQRRLVIGCKTA